MILELLVKTCRIPHLPKRAQIIFKGFCGHDFSLRLRKKEGLVYHWTLRRKEESWERAEEGDNGKVHKKK